MICAGKKLYCLESYNDPLPLMTSFVVINDIAEESNIETRMQRQVSVIAWMITTCCQPKQFKEKCV